ELGDSPLGAADSPTSDALVTLEPLQVSPHLIRLEIELDSRRIDRNVSPWLLFLKPRENTKNTGLETYRHFPLLERGRIVGNERSGLPGARERPPLQGD